MDEIQSWQLSGVDMANKIIRELRKNLRANLTQISDYQHENTELNNELIAKYNQINALEIENDWFRDGKKRLRDENKRLSHENKHLSNENEHLSNENKHLSDENEHLSSCLDRAWDAMHELKTGKIREKIEAMGGKVQAAQNEISDLQSQAATQDPKEAGLRERLGTLSFQVWIAKGEIRDLKNQTIAVTKGEYEAMMDVLKEQGSVVRNYKAENRELMEQVAVLKAELQAARMHN